jgi:hypothetical protein
VAVAPPDADAAPEAAPLAEPEADDAAEDAAGEAFEPHAVSARADKRRTAVRRTGRPRFDDDIARHSNGRT